MDLATIVGEHETIGPLKSKHSSLLWPESYPKLNGRDNTRVGEWKTEHALGDVPKAETFFFADHTPTQLGPAGGRGV